jgi:hypothetical protein
MEYMNNGTLGSPYTVEGPGHFPEDCEPDIPVETSDDPQTWPDHDDGGREDLINF